MRSKTIDAAFDGLKYRSLGQRAAGLLRRKIERGELPPGTRLTEEALSNALGISRPSIREALMILESDGLVVRRVRNKFTEVVQLSEQDVDEISGMRRALEVLAAATCIRRGVTPIAEMRLQAAEIEAVLDTEPFDLASYVDADFAFHELIVRACGNRRAIDAWQRLNSQMSMLLYMVVQGKPELTIAHSKSNHRLLLEAFERSDAEGVAGLMQEHLVPLPVLLSCLRIEAPGEAGESKGEVVSHG